MYNIVYVIMTNYYSSAILCIIIFPWLMPFIIIVNKFQNCKL